MDSTTPFQPWAANDGAKKDKELVDDAKHHRENVNHPKHTQTASYDKEPVVAPSNVPGPSSSAGLGGDPAKGKEGKMDSGKIASMQQIVENALSSDARQRVSQLLEAVEALNGTERLLLYLRLPTGVPPYDPLKQPVNPLGSRAELQQTVTWIQTHLEVDQDVSLPKQDVYDEYIAHCMSNNMKPLSTADFGKVMKQVYPSVRPRRLGTRGNSRYCYAGLRKKIKLEVPQLPDLGESPKDSTVTSRETEILICDWAESKLGVKINSLSELARHLLSASLGPMRPTNTPPPPLTALTPAHVSGDEQASRHLMKQLKRKIQTHGQPGRPKKYKGQEPLGESSPSTSYHLAVKHEGEVAVASAPLQSAPPPPAPPVVPPPAPYEYEQYVPLYETRAPYASYVPPRAHPVLPPRDLYYTRPRDLALADHHNLPINLSSDASLDLSTERDHTDWQRRRPPEPPPPPPPPPPPRLPLPGKKLILETYQSETAPARASPAPTPVPAPAPSPAPAPREYLPKKMRAAEILGGKLSAARHPVEPSTSVARSDAASLEDPKNVSSRSTSTAAALAREAHEAASSATVLLPRERVISICNMDKHDLDDYLHEGSSQENEEELLQYFHRDAAPVRPHTPTAPPPPPPEQTQPGNFLGPGLDHQDEHSQGKNDKICQLRELLAKNLKNISGWRYTEFDGSREPQSTESSEGIVHKQLPVPSSDGAFKPVMNNNASEATNGAVLSNAGPVKNNDANPMRNGNGIGNLAVMTDNSMEMLSANTGIHAYNGNGHNVPQSPTTRTQQYDFVPISDGCHSPRTFNSKSPLGFGHRSLSPSKVNKPLLMGGSLQTSPIPHNMAASPFVSPRNTPVPRSRLCPRPIPKLNGRKRRNPLSIGVGDQCPKQFAMPIEQKFMAKAASVPGIKYCQPMSAPPSPNIISGHYKNHNNMFQCATGMQNGLPLSLNFIPTPANREMNGDISQPLSADPLSSEVSQFFQDPLISYRPFTDTAFRSQSVPLKQGFNNTGLHNYKTPVGSVPPTPIPNEFCDFGSLADTCDISKAGLNSETLDKIYDAIDSSNDVLDTTAGQSLLNATDTMTNGCELLPEQQILTDELNSLLPNEDILHRNNHYSGQFADDGTVTNNVDDYLKRTNSLEFDLSNYHLNDKNKFYMSRSVPSTPLPYKRSVPSLQIDPRRSRALFPVENYVSNGISSKSVPSTPQMVEEKNVFSYSNRDFLINGNSVEACGNTVQTAGACAVPEHPLSPPLHEMLREDILDPLTPAADLLADLDKMEGPPYVDL